MQSSLESLLKDTKVPTDSALVWAMTCIVVSHADYLGSGCDVAFRNSARPWPSDLPLAGAKVDAIPSSKWRSYASVANASGAFLKKYVQVAEFTWQTPFGERLFHVWEHRIRRAYPLQPYQFAIIKPCSLVCLRVRCQLTQVPAKGLSAAFSLVGGKVFGSHDFGTWVKDVKVKHVVRAALKVGLRERLFESRTQPMELLFLDLEHPLPGRMTLWSEAANTAEPVHSATRQSYLDRWLDYLSNLPFDDLDSLALMDSSQKMNRLLGLSEPMGLEKYLRKHRKRCRPDRNADSYSTSETSSDEPPSG